MSKWTVAIVLIVSGVLMIALDFSPDPAPSGSVQVVTDHATAVQKYSTTNNETSERAQGAFDVIFTLLGLLFVGLGGFVVVFVKSSPAVTDPDGWY